VGCFINKKKLFKVFSFIFILFCFSCEKKESKNNINVKMSHYVYEKAVKEYSKSQTEKQSALYNSSLRNLLLSHFFVNGNNVLYLEYLYPKCKGAIETKNIPFVEDYSVFDLIITQTLEEISANKIQDLEIESGDQVDNTAKEIKNVLENSDKIEKIVASNYNNLKFLEFEDELLLFGNDEKVLIEKNQNNLFRKFFDENHRLVKKENWTTSSLKASKIISTELYQYYDNTLVVKEKIEISNSKKIISKYNFNGLVENVMEYVIFDKKDFIIKNTEYKYNDNNSKSSEKIINYVYKDERYKKILKTTEQLYKYFYINSEEIPADSEYYENNKLLIKTVYSSVKGNYTNEVFFDGGLSIKTFYEDNVRKKDIYYENGSEKRIVNYE